MFKNKDYEWGNTNHRNRRPNASLFPLGGYVFPSSSESVDRCALEASHDCLQGVEVLHVVTLVGNLQEVNEIQLVIL